MAKPKFSVGQIVFHKAVIEKQPGIVVGVTDYGGGLHYYNVDWGPSDGTSEKFEVALSATFVPDYGVVE